MSIRSILIQVVDVARAVDFYERHLGLVPREVTAHWAILDAVTAVIELRRVSGDERSTFVSDDLQTGFRHVGFKVTDLDGCVAELKAAGVAFHLEPVHAEGGVRLTFFYDPDGTLLELVEGPLQYHDVFSPDAVEADWALGDPDRPRFDHIAETVTDLAATERYFAQLGYTRMAGIHQPHDTRGFEIVFLRSGDTSLEIFTFERADGFARAPQLGAPGFTAVEFEGDVPPSAQAVGTAFGRELYTDQDGLLHAVHGGG